MISKAQSGFDGLIYLVLLRVPTHVKYFADTYCTFTFLEDHVAGMTLRIRKPWVIMLNLNILDRYDAEECQGIIAHEIAHAYLNHDSLKIGNVREETAATQLASEWGFTGIGAMPPDER